MKIFEDEYQREGVGQKIQCAMYVNATGSFNYNKYRSGNNYYEYFRKDRVTYYRAPARWAISGERPTRDEPTRYWKETD